MPRETGETDWGHYDLMGKTELTIRPIALDGANLNDIAEVTADVLCMERGEVWVVDVRGDSLTIDVLREHADAHDLVGKQEELLRRLDALPGVQVNEETSVTSAGMLGWIAMDGEEMREALDRSERMAAGMLERIKKRAVVFSTGPEVAGGQIEDTNTPAIARRLAEGGYSVAGGGTIADDRALIAGKIRRAASEDGFGMVITTGGVGAEDKDHTVEAVLSLDPEAATPYITRHEIGTGRHVKDGVRIAVGQFGGALIVSLPGPNDEVTASLEKLVDGLISGAEKNELAESIAQTLRERLREKYSHYHPQD